MTSSVARPSTPPSAGGDDGLKNRGFFSTPSSGIKVDTSNLPPTGTSGMLFGGVSPTLPSPISIYQHVRCDSNASSASGGSPPTECSPYFPVGHPQDVPRLTRAFSLPSSCAAGLCTRHHHRHGTVAIKFSPTYLEDPFYDDDDTSAASVGRRYSTSSLRRPPSPVAERILKGDIEF
jgi:hypothetical protein